MTCKLNADTTNGLKLTSDTSGIVDIQSNGTTKMTVGTTIDIQGNELVLDADADTSIHASTDNQIDFKTGGTDRMHIDSSGNVGIGTSSPSEKFVVMGKASFGSDWENNTGTGLDNFQFGSYTDTDAAIQIKSTSAGSISWSDDNTSRYGIIQYNHTGDYMSFWANNSERMRIISSGNVGIGTTSPSQKLDVNGTINATAFTGDGSALTGISAGDIAAASIGTSNNSNGYIRFTNNFVIQWLRKSQTGTQTITYPLAMNNYYGAYVAGVSTGNGHVRVHSIGTSSITVSNAEQNILGWVLVTGRKT